jgi:uracil-DNA glycosylase
MSKQQQLDAIKQQILDDKVCPELAEGATQLVFGDGNPEAELVFVGEAPGKNEDLQGIPFVGAAGKFLNEMLEMIDLKREDVYITNIVKYRPPNNRDPYPDEKKVFLPYLQSQLEAIQPKIVATLGRHGLNCFLPDLQISQVHGQPKRVKLALKGKSDDSLQVVILPLFHPAAALYNGDMRQTLIDDFALIPAIIEKLNQS